MDNDLRKQAGVSSLPYPASTYAWYVVIVLTITYTISFIDRQILALLVGPIRQDLQISDTEISLLIGLAFATFYTLLGIPIARLADRYSRRLIIAVGITIWCAMTAACGLSNTYAQLFIARVGVGVGEAALGPSALSMISDYFPPEKRGRAIAFYTMGISLGAGLAMIVGGELIAFVSSAPKDWLPQLGDMAAWQKVFILVGLPGLLMAAVMLTVREPVRRERLSDSKDGAALSFKEVVDFLMKRWKLYGSHFLGMSVVAILTYGFLAWIPQLFVRTWGWTIRDIGLAYGIVTLISGVLAVPFVSGLAAYFERRGRTDVYMRVAWWAAMLGTVGAVLVPLMPTPQAAVVMLLPVSVGTVAATGAGLTALMVITPNEMRAQTSAVYYLVVNILGLTMGPTGIALFTDFVFRNDAMLGYSILCVSLLAGAFSFGLLSYNLGQYRRALADTANWRG